MASNEDKDALLSVHSSNYAHSLPDISSTGHVYLTRGSINSNVDSMSYYSEGDFSMTGSVDSSSTYPSVSAPVHTYGAVAFSPSGSETRVLLTDFDAFPVNLTCTKCKQDVVSKVRHKSGKLALMSSGVIALFGGILGCCLIPCCINSLKDVVHECPNCGTVLGMYKRKANCIS